MQYSSREYDERQHDRFKALTVQQPAAALITQGRKTIELRALNTKYRGPLLVCSSAKPEIVGLLSGASQCFAELYDVKPAAQFTSQEWDAACVLTQDRDQHRNKFGWFFRDIRPVVEFPVKCRLGIFDLIYTKDTIIEYPRNVVIDHAAAEQMEEQRKRDVLFMCCGAKIETDYMAIDQAKQHAQHVANVKGKAIDAYFWNDIAQDWEYFCKIHPAL